MHLKVLSLVGPSLPFAGPGPAILSRRSLSVFRCIFPINLRCPGSSNQPFDVRRFSNPPFRTGSESASELSRGSSRTVRVSKSLIEDEAELSDWISDLRTKSLRGRLTSEDEDMVEDRARSGPKSRDRERNRGSVKRRRENESEDFGNSNQRSSRVKSVDSFSRNSRYSKPVDNKLESDDDAGNEQLYFRRKSGESRKFGGNMAKLKGNGRDKGLGAQKPVKEKITFSRKLSVAEEDERDDDDDDDDDEEEEEEEETYPAVGRIMGGISDLLREDASDDEDSNFADDALEKKVSSAFGLDASDRKNVPTSPVKSDSYLSDNRFDQFSISPLTLKAIKDAGFEKMTVVQAATLPVCLKGKDVLAKAKTGTGKTLGFLVPSIEVVQKSPSIDRDVKRPPILVLIVCPTRELAIQASAEANKLLKYHPSIGVQVVIGGTRLSIEQKSIQANPCQILVATPGRLRDHIENTAGFATKLMGVKVLVLDEADRLLDMGFRKEIEKIVAAVPKQRQTLLFSATVPKEVLQMCHIALKRDHEFINTVGEGTEETNSQVRQTYLVAPLENHFPILYALLKDHIADNVDYKVVVFCTTAMVTKLVAELLSELNLNVREIHSRKSQSYRTKVSDEFRKSKGLILVTSDVSARGVDYPDITLVIQVGLPSGREQYIHRLGRTGRKGKEGEGILLLAPWEEFFQSTIKDLPITKAPLPSVDLDTKKKVEKALCHVEMKSKESAYQAWLGYYNSDKKVGRDKCQLVKLANQFSRSMGLDAPPAISKLILGKMGLKTVPGLRSK